MAPDAAPSSTSAIDCLKRIICACEDIQQRFPTVGDPAALHSDASPPPSLTLAAPPDIIPQLSALGLSEDVARSLSAIYVEKVESLRHAHRTQFTASYAQLSQLPRPHESVPMSRLAEKLQAASEKVFSRNCARFIEEALHLARVRVQPEEADESSVDSDDNGGASSDSWSDESDDEGETQNLDPKFYPVLENLYQKNIHFPKRHEKAHLSRLTGLSYRQVGVWFQNRRERDRMSSSRGTAKAESVEPASSRRAVSVVAVAPSPAPGASTSQQTSQFTFEINSRSTPYDAAIPSEYITTSDSEFYTDVDDSDWGSDSECGDETSETDHSEEPFGTRVVDYHTGAFPRIPSPSHSIPTIPDAASRHSSDVLSQNAFPNASPGFFEMTIPLPASPRSFDFSLPSSQSSAATFSFELVHEQSQPPSQGSYASNSSLYGDHRAPAASPTSSSFPSGSNSSVFPSDYDMRTPPNSSSLGSPESSQGPVTPSSYVWPSSSSSSPPDRNAGSSTLSSTSIVPPTKTRPMRPLPPSNKTPTKERQPTNMFTFPATSTFPVSQPSQTMFSFHSVNPTYTAPAHTTPQTFTFEMSAPTPTATSCHTSNLACPPCTSSSSYSFAHTPASAFIHEQPHQRHIKPLRMNKPPPHYSTPAPQSLTPAPTNFWSHTFSAASTPAPSSSQPPLDPDKSARLDMAMQKFAMAGGNLGVNMMHTHRVSPW
ncbi:hypothetical protein BOTBODRAFT_142470 [Botryobasidium botryosum FD-172 SS1]|uniref:Homeobox domain-containing protein n=1 Tax=Botryobasidium botryosum (strain FD-172 SS1) TaxID=930990 RepID=A0A067MVU6_BOTB1|nr:hypothetical protein BOTBODRAFT_142470 [Botryobasidium botryosum FD-172 SS1]